MFKSIFCHFNKSGSYWKSLKHMQRDDFFYSPCTARCTPFCINCTWHIWWLTWMQLFAIQTGLFSLLSSKRLFHWKCTNFGTKKIGKRGRLWKMTWSHTHTPRHNSTRLNNGSIGFHAIGFDKTFRFCRVEVNELKQNEWNRLTHLVLLSNEMASSRWRCSYRFGVQCMLRFPITRHLFPTALNHLKR